MIIIPGDAVSAGLADAGDAPAHPVDDALGAARHVRQAVPAKKKQTNFNEKVNKLHKRKAMPEEVPGAPGRRGPRALQLVLGAVEVGDVVVGGICWGRYCSILVSCVCENL